MIQNSRNNKEDQVGRIFPFFSCRSVDIIIQWSTTTTAASGWSGTIKGQTCIFDLKVGATHNYIRECIDDVVKSMGGGGIVGMLKESRAERRLMIDGISKSEMWNDEECLRVSVEIPQSTFIEFSSKELSPSTKSIKVGVKFWLRNLSPTKTITYKMELDSKSLNRPTTVVTTTATLQSSMQATPWIGMLVYNGSLKPLEKDVHIGTMYISGIGVYDAGRCIVKTDMGTIICPETNVYIV